MSGSSLSGRRLALAEEMARAAGRAEAAVRSRAGEAAAPGDRFVLEATADWPVEWVLLERHGERPKFLAVPADTQPLVGAADVAVPAGSAAGALSLRCRFPVWLEAGQLDLALRVGAIDEISLAKARQKVREAGTGTAAEIDLEGSVAYGDWIRETLSPALVAVGGGVEARTAEPRREVLPPRSRPALAWAAALAALLLAVALAGWGLRQERRLERLAAGLEQAERERWAAVAREAEAGAVERRRTAGILEQRKAEEKRLRERIAELETRAAPAPQAVLNVPFALLYPTEALRGPAKTVRVPPGAHFFLAVLSVEEATSHPSYRVIVTRKGRSAPVLQSDGLALSSGEVSLALPGELLLPGTYRFELFGLSDGKATPVAEYEIAITR